MRTDVANLYVSLFGRAPERDGLGFWVQQLDTGKSVADIAQEMYDTAPARAYYPTFLSNEEIVGKFYTNVLGRTADAEGLAFWTNKLNAGASKGALIAEMISAVQTYAGTDTAALASKALLANKVAVSLYYAVDLGGNDVAKASIALNGVTDSATSVETAKAAVSVSAGTSFALTSSSNTATGGIDAVVGTNGSDVVSGLVNTATGGSTTTSFGAGDQINGGAGTDTLQLTIVGDGAGTSSSTGAVVQNVETLVINNSVTAGSYTYDATTTTGLKAVTIGSSGTQGTTVSALTPIVDATMSNGKGSLTLNYTAATVQGAADTQNLTVSGQTAGTFTADGIETVKLTAGPVASKGITVAGAQLTTINVAGAGDVTFTAAAGVKTVDASAATGKVAVTGSNAALKVTGGSGDDTITFSGAFATTVSVDGGAGKDTLVVTGDVNGTEFTNVKNVETLSLSTTGNITALDASKITGLSTVLGQLSNTTGAKAAITIGGTIASATAAVTFNVNGVDYATTTGSTTNATSATALATYINGTAGIKDLLSASAAGGVLTITYKTATPAAVKVNTADTGLTFAWNGQAAANLTAATTVANDAVATSGTMAINNLADASTVKVDSSNLGAVAVDGTTQQSTALNKMGAVTANVKDAALATNASNSVTFEMNNNNTKSTATTAANKVFTVDGFTAAGVESVTVNSIGAFGTNTLSSLDISGSNANASKMVSVTGSTDLTITSIAATGTTASPAITVGLDASKFTGGLTATFAAGTYGDQVITGGAGNDTITLAANSLTGGDTIDLGAGTNRLNISTNVDAGIINVKNVQTLGLTSTADVASVDLRNVTGLTKVVVTNAANNASVLNLADNATVNLLGAGASGKGVSLSGMTGATTINVTTGTDQTGNTAATAVAGYGTTNAQNLTLASGYKTANITFDGAELASATTPAVANSALKDVSLGTVQDLSFNVSNFNGTAGVTAPTTTVDKLTATSLTNLSTITINGGGSATNQTFTIKAIDDFTNVTKIDASGLNASLNLGFDGTSTYDSFRLKDGASVTTGSGNDTITWLATFNAAETINAGSNAAFSATNKGDTLVIFGTQNAGQTVVDLSSATDQVTMYNGGANASTQIGFESVNLSNLTGFGATVTAAAAGSNIVASNQSDIITGGAGNDVITGLNGGDTINVGTGTDTLVYTAAQQTLRIATAAGAVTTTGLSALDVVTGMGAGDKIDFTAFGGGFNTTIVTTNVAADTKVNLLVGTWNASTGAFTAGAGADTLVIVDEDGSGTGVNFDAIVLVGFNGTGSTLTAAGVLTLG